MKGSATSPFGSFQALCQCFYTLTTSIQQRNSVPGAAVAVPCSANRGVEENVKDIEKSGSVVLNQCAKQTKTVFLSSVR